MRSPVMDASGAIGVARSPVAGSIVTRSGSKPTPSKLPAKKRTPAASKARPEPDVARPESLTTVAAPVARSIVTRSSVSSDHPKSVPSAAKAMSAVEKFGRPRDPTRVPSPVAGSIV